MGVGSCSPYHKIHYIEIRYIEVWVYVCVSNYIVCITGCIIWMTGKIYIFSKLNFSSCFIATKSSKETSSCLNKMLGWVSVFGGRENRNCVEVGKKKLVWGRNGGKIVCQMIYHFYLSISCWTPCIYCSTYVVECNQNNWHLQIQTLHCHYRCLWR